MSCLPKPNLRGHIMKFGFKTIIESAVVGCLVSAAYYFFVSNPRQKQIDEVLKNYNAEAHYKELVAYGYLQSAKQN